MYLGTLFITKAVQYIIVYIVTTLIQLINMRNRNMVLLYNIDITWSTKQTLRVSNEQRDIDEQRDSDEQRVMNREILMNLDIEPIQ